jgi:integrase
MAPDVAEVLARPGQRRHWTGADDLVFPGDAGGYLDASALRRRYDRALAYAALRPLRFHDLRHTFGTRTSARADIRRAERRTPTKPSRAGVARTRAESLAAGDVPAPNSRRRGVDLTTPQHRCGRLAELVANHAA